MISTSADLLHLIKQTISRMTPEQRQELKRALLDRMQDWYARQHKIQ